jgi:peptidoglycan/xylan/chitin deacetylase (PgdA/CDA1 family)
MRSKGRRLPAGWWLLALVLGSAQGSDADVSGHFPWPGGAKAAISLQYDDALDSHLDHAIPALNRHGLKASFYLILSSATLERRMPDWRAAAAQGHELGNHTLFHSCSGKIPGRDGITPDNDLDRVSAAQLVAQIRVGNTMLGAIDGRKARTFSVPCGDLLAAGEAYLPLIRDDFVAIKSGIGGVIADMRELDPHAVLVAAPTDVTGEQLIAIATQAAERGTMANFTFHGIGGDYLSISNEAHEALLAHLAAHRDLYWTDTFLNIVAYAKSRRATTTP